MMFHDNLPNDQDFAEFYRLFDEKDPQPFLHSSLDLLQIDITHGDLPDVMDLISELPHVVVLDNGKKVIEEKLTKHTDSTL